MVFGDKIKYHDQIILSLFCESDLSTLMTLPVGTTTATEEEITSQPNTALLSLILTMGTFAIASYLKSFKSSHYLGKTVSDLVFTFEYMYFVK